MSKHHQAYVSTAAEIVWRMGGRICDLPGHVLDRIAAVVTQSPWRPPQVEQAQQLMDTYTERYRTDVTEVDHAQR